VALSGDPDKVRSELAAVHARYVVIADDHETVFDGTSGTWWIELLRQGDFRVIQLQP
jgi:hypothetical protein